MKSFLTVTSEQSFNLLLKKFSVACAINDSISISSWWTITVLKHLNLVSTHIRLSQPVLQPIQQIQTWYILWKLIPEFLFSGQFLSSKKERILFGTNTFGGRYSTQNKWNDFTGYLLFSIFHPILHFLNERRKIRRKQHSKPSNYLTTEECEIVRGLSVLFQRDKLCFASKFDVDEPRSCFKLTRLLLALRTQYPMSFNYIVKPETTITEKHIYVQTFLLQHLVSYQRLTVIRFPSSKVKYVRVTYRLLWTALKNYSASVLTASPVGMITCPAFVLKLSSLHL